MKYFETKSIHLNAESYYLHKHLSRIIEYFHAEVCC